MKYLRQRERKQEREEERKQEREEERKEEKSRKPLFFKKKKDKRALAAIKSVFSVICILNVCVSI